MASAVIHIAVAKELSKYFDIKNYKDYYLGSIAPDIAKEVNSSRNLSHFLIDNDDIPDIGKFIEKYPDFRNNDFDLGYFIHLYTDKIWFSNFINKLYSGDFIKTLDGVIIKVKEDEVTKIIYQDYTNLNVSLISKYNLDLSLFYDEFIKPNTNIDEIPVDKLNVLIEKMGLIIKNSEETKSYMFDMNYINDFIKETIEEIVKYLNID